MSDERWTSAEEASTELNGRLGARQIRRLAKEKKVRSRHEGGRVLVEMGSLNAYLADNRTDITPPVDVRPDVQHVRMSPRPSVRPGPSGNDAAAIFGDLDAGKTAIQIVQERGLAPEIVAQAAETYRRLHVQSGTTPTTERLNRYEKDRTEFEKSVTEQIKTFQKEVRADINHIAQRSSDTEDRTNEAERQVDLLKKERLIAMDEALRIALERIAKLESNQAWLFSQIADLQSRLPTALSRISDLETKVLVSRLG